MPTEDANETEETGGESNPVRVLRNRVNELEGEAARASELERQLAFAKAGVDLDTKAGQYFFKGYDGELSATAIREELKTLGISSEPPKVEGDVQEHDAGERASSDERSRLVTGASNEIVGEDPRVVAINSAEDLMRGGATRVDAIGEAFGHLAMAGFVDNDQRVLYVPGQQ